MICTQCGTEMTGRADARYCSAKCRMKANRNKTEAVSVTDVTDKLSVTDTDKPANFGQSNCQCRHCQNNRTHGSRLTINHGPYKPASELRDGEVNRVSLPSDVDYRGCVV